MRVFTILFAAAATSMLVSCGSEETLPAGNEATVSEANVLEEAAGGPVSAPPSPPPPSDDRPHQPLPPPPAPGEPEGEPPGSEEPQPATEDEYLRNSTPPGP